MKYATIIIALLCAGCYSGCTAPPAPVQQSKIENVKINQFYPRDLAITEGDKTVLCYGVENAKSVRIDPPVDGVSPSLTRCVEVSPKRTTHYTLIAESSDGRSISQSADIQVGADTSSLPKVTSFAIAGCTKDYQGEAVFTVTFAAQNANEISIDPPAFPTLHGTLFGKFGVKPDKAATYTLIASGKNGHVAKQKLTLDPGTCK